MKGKYMPISYNWLQSFFAKPLPSPEELAQLITTGTFEIEEMVPEGNDVALDVKVLPDRAPDAFSHRGIAREVGVLTGISWNDPFAQSFPTFVPMASDIILKNESDACRSHMLARIDAVRVGPSPDWLVERLHTIGQRSINNIVDATNYVLFELGQPVHVFDWDKLAEENGARGITVRTARDGEHITLLGGKEVSLTSSMTVLSDAVSGAALDIAGVKGGVQAELTHDTKNILITVAHYDPVSIRKTSRALNIRTDASKRSENGTAPALVGYGVARTVDLIIEIAGGTLHGFASYNMQTPDTKTITVSCARINSLLGTNISLSDMKNLLHKQGFSCDGDEDMITVGIPFERLDIAIAEDIAEEVARVFGYNNIDDAVLPPSHSIPEVLPARATAEQLRATLSQQAFTEVLTYSLNSTGAVVLQNALSSDKNALRDNLTQGIADALNKNEYNAPLLGIHDAIQIFEIGSVFLPDETEDVRVCIGVRVLSGTKKEDRANEAVQKALSEIQKVFGTSVTCNAKHGIAEFSLSALVAQAPLVYTNNDRIGVISYAPFSAYPFVLRDLALWVSSDVAVVDVYNIIVREAGELLVRADVFDQFSKEGRTSYAFHLVFQSTERTLTDAEVTEHMQKVENALRAKGFEVR